jgi:hypothetical protein
MRGLGEASYVEGLWISGGRASDGDDSVAHDTDVDCRTQLRMACEPPLAV